MRCVGRLVVLVCRSHLMHRCVCVCVSPPSGPQPTPTPRRKQPTSSGAAQYWSDGSFCSSRMSCFCFRCRRLNGWVWDGMLWIGECSAGCGMWWVGGWGWVSDLMMDAHHPRPSHHHDHHKRSHTPQQQRSPLPLDSTPSQFRHADGATTTCN